MTTTSYDTPIQPTKSESVPQGMVRLVKLQTPGKLQKGDVVETSRLGQCKVVYIQTRHSICVKNKADKHFMISGLGFEGRLVQNTAQAN